MAVPPAVYIHGTERSEQARLAALNALTNPAFVEFLQVAPGARVLEVGSGLGILAAAVAQTAAGVQVTGVEISPEQLRAAVQAPGVEYRQGDAQRLPFPDGSFDLVYARFLLEHVGDPLEALREMRRVARPGGRVAVMENDISTCRFDPPCPTFDQVWSVFAQLQGTLGGDAFIGRRLFRLFREAGFTGVTLSLQPELHWSGSPGFRPWVDNTIGNIAGAREALVSGRHCTAAALESAIAELTALLSHPGASSSFAWNRAVAVRA
jgi:SAM-dependent methyltransferase